MKLNSLPSTKVSDKESVLRMFEDVLDIDEKIPVVDDIKQAILVDEEEEDDETITQAVPLYTKADILSAISDKKGLELVWQGFLGQSDPTQEDRIKKKIDSIRSLVYAAYAANEERKWIVEMAYKHWHLQVYMTKGRNHSVILLTSPNLAYFWKHEGLKESLDQFFKDPAKVATETRIKLLTKYYKFPSDEKDKRAKMENEQQ